MLYYYKNFHPSLGQECFLAPGVQIIGRATLGDHVNIWFGTIVRADVAPIDIGECSNIQDQCMLHVTEVSPLYIGKNVSVAHKVMLHGCRIEDSCLIGMGTTIMDGVVVGENSLVAAGSLLPPGKNYPPSSLIKGSPARVERSLREEEKKQIANHYLSYLQYKKEYLLPQYFGRMIGPNDEE